MKNNTIIIGIAGASSSGKSLLANTIVNELGSEQVVIISEDAYYKARDHLTMAEREKINYDHPDAFDHTLLLEHLKQLQQGQTVPVPRYNYTLHTRDRATTSVGRHAIIVLEGILLFCEPALRELMDMRIFVDAPLDICLLRRLSRDVVQRGRSIESVMEQYEKTVRPMYLQFIEPSKRYADVIVPRGGNNRVAIELIKAKMNALLDGKLTLSPRQQESSSSEHIG